MNESSWRYTFASVAGTSHLKNDKPCQDHAQCCVTNEGDGSPVIVAIVADGAGSATHSQIGSELACSLFMSEMEAIFQAGGRVSEISRDFLKQWIVYLCQQIDIRAEAEALTRRDFACTILAAVIGDETAAFFQVGDGAIIVPSNEEPDDYCWIFWPQQGEYENTTTFVTDDRALESFEHSICKQRLDEVALLTDGLQRVALDFRNQTAHSPFFKSMFAPLRPVADGHSEKLSAALTKYLSSPQINDRTDDDKTLVLATRCARPLSPVGKSEDHANQDEQQNL